MMDELRREVVIVVLFALLMCVKQSTLIERGAAAYKPEGYISIGYSSWLVLR